MTRATRAMVIAARRAEFDHYQRSGQLGERFIPTPDDIIELMIQAALDVLDPPAPEAPGDTGKAALTPRPSGRVVVSAPPRRRR